jgi:arabinose-5-phosphate isomerase
VTLSPPLTETASTDRVLGIALRTLAIEAEGLASLQQRLAHDLGARGAFAEAVEMILRSTTAPQHGRVIVSGMGKSGHIARKIAATLASTGTPAYFVHPAEASHGDLGMVTGQDVFIAISNSGESQELLAIVPILKRSGAKLIAMTGQPTSALAKLADAHLDSGVQQEACPLNLAPTASTTVQLALGDALAVALLDERGFDANDFARSHPGGALGRKLLTRVRDVMRSGAALPHVTASASLPEAILEISRKGIGMTAVMNEHKQVVGVFTDGDLRRLLEKSLDLSGLSLVQVMNTAPKSIAPEALAAEAAEVMDRHKVNQLLVLEQGLLVGALHLHDLMAAKVI